MIHIAFVCLGNICRSPVAEGVFRHLVRQRSVEHLFDIDSAGTAGYHNGDPPDARSAATARARGITVEGRSRQLGSEDLNRFDHIIVMDAENLSTVRRMAARHGATAKVSLLRDWDPEGPGGDVPDPYYGGPRGFEDVHDIIDRSCENLLEHLLADATSKG